MFKFGSGQKRRETADIGQQQRTDLWASHHPGPSPGAGRAALANRLRQRWKREGVGRRGSPRALAQNLPQNGVEDTTVAEELDLGRGVDPHAGRKGETLAGGADGLHLDEAAGVQPLRDAAHVEDLVALQAKRGGVLPVLEL